MTDPAIPARPASPTYDVAVIGAGSAGLQAAQTLGRMHQRTVVLGEGRHRNDPAAAMHNFLGHDGTPPADLRAAARADAEAYDDVTFVDVAVAGVAGTLGDFTLTLADGARVRARRLVLATGVRDTLPTVPGLAEQFGDLVAHCPFCHGHELAAGGTVAVWAPGPQAIHLASMLAAIADEVVLLTDGEAPDDALRTAAEALGARVRTERVREVHRPDPARRELGVVLDGGGVVRVGGMFVRTTVTQAAPFAADLGLDLTEMDAVVVDVMGRTSVPGVYAAGDLAAAPGLPMAMASVLSAAAAGLAAAAGCVQDAAAERLAGAVSTT